MYLSFKVLRLHKITLEQSVMVNEVRILYPSVLLTFGSQKEEDFANERKTRRQLDLRAWINKDDHNHGGCTRQRAVSI